MTDRSRFLALADELEMDEFERIAAWDIFSRLEVVTDKGERAQLYMSLGALFIKHIERWVGE